MTQSVGKRQKPKHVLVWAVYPPGAGWRGEGITQSIENIVLHSPDDIHFTLLLSAEHRIFAEEALGERTNVKIVPLGLQLRKMKTWQNTRELIEGIGPASTVLEKIDRAAEWLTDKVLSLTLRLAGVITGALVDRHFRDVDVIFNPSPVYCFTRKKKIPKVFGFWDPFVFEYTDFGKNRYNALRSFMYRFMIHADQIITQSEANKEYLINIWGVAPDKINVIFNGSPDYGDIYSHYCRSIDLPRIDRDSIAPSWPRRELKAYRRVDAARTFFSEILNESVLFRLQKSVRKNTKFIMISTQYRPYKGFESLFSLLDYLLNLDTGYDFRFIFTAEIPDKTRGQFSGKYTWFTERTYELTRLSNLQHACLYSLCDLVLHPSLVEGGPTLYPASEAASLGVPSLTNTGRHTRELLSMYGSRIDAATADFLNKPEASARILDALGNYENRGSIVQLVNDIRVNWADSSKEYAEVFRSY